MAQKISFYITDRGIAELDELVDGLSELSGCPISRSAALTSLLENQAGIYLETRRRLVQVVQKYRPEYVTAEEKSND